jgi:hypothetical protein
MANSKMPALSVVVVSFSGSALLQECLASLISQPDFRQMDVHIVTKKKEGDTQGYGKEFPNIFWHVVAANETVPRMRTVGFMESKADLVALLEGDCTVGPQWCSSILEAHKSCNIAVGGAIEPGDYSRGIDWAVYYCEFGRFLSPLSGVVAALPGTNVSYKKSAIDLEEIKDGFYEVFLHSRWQDTGVELYAADGMMVTNNGSWLPGDCVSVPFHHGRAYAARRFGTGYGPRRVISGLLAIVLPLVKTLRTLREVTSRCRTELPLLKALPWIVVFYSCWSVGEFFGYLTGPGQSIEKWR